MGVAVRLKGGGGECQLFVCMEDSKCSKSKSKSKKKKPSNKKEKKKRTQLQCGEGFQQDPDMHNTQTSRPERKIRIPPLGRGG